MILLCYSLLTKQAPFPLPEMSFLEQGQNTPWPSPAMTTGSERSHGKQGAKASRWTRQEALKEGELPGLGEGEAKASSGELGVGAVGCPRARGWGSALGPSIAQRWTQASSCSLSFSTWERAAALTSQGPSTANSGQSHYPNSETQLSHLQNGATAPRLPKAAVRLTQASR